mgnify:CR=1 FL=1
MLVCGCDFGTLDDLSQDEAATGSSETSAQAIALWTSYEASDDEIKKAVAGMEGVVAGAGPRPVQATIDDLTKEQLGIPTITRDPAAAQGMLVITELDCSLDQVEKILVAKNQPEIYPGTYDEYERTYTTSIQDFLANAASSVGWKTKYTVSLLERRYTSTLTGGARRVAGAAPGGGTMLLARTFLDEPARFIAGEDAEFNQDYQIEAYWEIGPKRVIHFYAMWREFRVGTLSSSHNFYVNIVLGNLVDFDVRTSKVCRDGTPVPAFE